MGIMNMALTKEHFWWYILYWRVYFMEKNINNIGKYRWLQK